MAQSRTGRKEAQGRKGRRNVQRSSVRTAHRRKGGRKDAQKRKGKVEEDLHALTIERVRTEKERHWAQRDRDLKEKFKVGSNSGEQIWQLLRNVAAAEECSAFLTAAAEKCGS